MRPPIEPSASEQVKTPDTDLLLRFVADRDEPCPICAYSLRGLAEQVCPECGAPLRLQVGSPQTGIAAWALGMISFALALGFDGVVSILFTVGLLLSPTTNWQPIGLVTGFVTLSGSMLAGMIWLSRSRRAWHRRPTRVQWRWGAAIFLGVGLMHALVGAAFVIIANT